MKLKRTKIALISIIALCLLLNVSYTQASVNVLDISCPSEVKLGKTFTVVVKFEFEYTMDALYGDYIWLYYNTGLSPYVDVTGTQFIAKTISTPKPESVSIEVDTSEITCAVNDTFRFRIKYHKGILDGMTGVYDQGEAWTENYDVIILEGAARTSMSFLSVIIPLFTVTTIILLRRRCSNNEIK